MPEVPEPSIRRAIQSLRAQGHNISFAGDYTRLYRLGSPYDHPQVAQEVN